MSGREFEPGDVAAVTMTHGETVNVYPRCIWDNCNKQWVSGTDGALYPSEHVWRITEVRPLVVIDPDDRKQVERFRNETLRALRDQLGNRAVDDMAFTDVDLANAMQAALRSLVTPPRPPEPQGLYAVVEDDKAREWVRAELVGTHQWHSLEGVSSRWADWSAIAAVRVLSDGVPQ